MKDAFYNLLRVAAVAAAALFAMLPPEGVQAQTVTQQPQFVAPRTVLDLGNGPQELKILTGSAGIFTSQGSGVGSTSGSSTALTLTATPVTAPCVGCILSGTGITSGTTVSAFNGTTTITMSSAMTVSASTAIAWGAACPVSTQSAPAVPAASFLMALVAAGVGGDFPFNTQARMCAYGATGPGAQLLSFTIGAH